MSPRRVPDTASIFGARSWLGAYRKTPRSSPPAPLMGMTRRPRSHPQPSSTSVARDAYSSLLDAQDPRWPAQRTQPGPAIRELRLADRQLTRLRSCRGVVACRRTRPRGCGRRASPCARSALGQAVANEQINRFARAVATSERCVIGAALRATPPTPPRASLDVHAAGRVTVTARVRVRRGEAPHRRLALHPARQLDAEGGVEPAHIRARQRAGHARPSASTCPFFVIEPTSTHAVDLHRAPLTGQVSARPVTETTAGEGAATCGLLAVRDGITAAPP